MDIWAEVKIGFNAEQETMMEDIKFLLKENGEFLLYPKALQVEKANVFGYLLFSVRSMERARLIETIQHYADIELNKKLEINAIWRRVVDRVIVPRGGRKHGLLTMHGMVMEQYLRLLKNIVMKQSHASQIWAHSYTFVMVLISFAST